MQQVPDKAVYASNYATLLAWAADAQSLACHLDNAIALRQKVIHLAENLSQSDPGDNNLKRRYAYAISGVASLQASTGQLDLAEKNLGRVISILEQMSAADPSNMLYPQQIAYRQLRLAKLIAAMGRPAEAEALMLKLDPLIGAESGAMDQNEEAIQTAIDFHLAYAGIEYQSGDKASANQQLEKALDLLVNHPQHEAANSEMEMLQEMRFQWWEINGRQGLEEFPEAPQPRPIADGELRSCEDALNTARTYVMEGDLAKAAAPVRYLQERGYAAPAFMQFCTKYALCSAPPAPTG